MPKDKPTLASLLEDVQEVKAELTELHARLDALEAAARAFAVVYAIPRIHPGDGKQT